MSQVDTNPAQARSGPSPQRSTGRATLSLLGSELRVLYRRRRTWAMLAALSALPILLAVAVKLSGSPQEAEGPPFLDRVTNNGLFVGVTAIILSVPLFLPLTVGVVAGDSIAGESAFGTLRYLLVAPTGRVRLLLVKFVSALSFCLVAALTVVAVGAAIGAVLFPLGSVTLLSGNEVSASTALLRALAVGGYAALSLFGLVAVGLFISTLTDVPIGAMAATIVVAVVVQVLDALPQLDWLHPWLFSHYWFNLVDLLREPIAWASLQDNALLQAGYVAVFGAAAYGRFVTRDILA